MFKDRTYNPKIFRQFDRDGLTQDHISIIESHADDIYKNSLPQYKIGFLPVCEMENFAIINKDISEISETVKIEAICELHKAVQGRLEEISKIIHGKKNITDDKKQLFKAENTAPAVKKAGNDIIRYYPGKNVLSGINAIDKITEMPNEDNLPQELTTYMQEIGHFFNS